MKVSTIMQWVGPVAIAGALFAVISDQLGLVVHLPPLGAEEPTSYHAVGMGLFMFVVMLLFVGMLGLYAQRPDPNGPKAIEYGDAHARYVLVEEPKDEPRLPARPAGRRDKTRTGLLGGRAT